MDHPELEMAIVQWLASVGGRYRFLDRTTAVMVDSAVFRALPAVAILAGYWGARLAPQRSLQVRRTVLAGGMAAATAMVSARIIQDFWPTPRPIYDPALSGLFRSGATIDPDYNSFPSDHAAFLLPLVWTVCRLHPWLGAATALLLAATLAARAFQGLHFPVDLAGGLAIGALAMVLVGRPGSGVVKHALGLIHDAQTRWPWPTAAGLFVVAYGYASMFEAFRFLLSAMARALGGW